MGQAAETLEPRIYLSCLAATRRPVTGRALSDMATAPTWKRLPYVIYGSADRNIPAETQRFMAERAGTRKTVAVEGGSHALMVSHPDKVAALIEDAASARCALVAAEPRSFPRRPFQGHGRRLLASSPI